MAIQEWVYLATICFLGACSPGPSLLVVLGFVSSEGKRAGISVSIGHGLGVLVYAFLSTLGLSILITQSDLAFNIVQLVGAVSLVWIAFRLIAGSKKQKTKTSDNFIRESYMENSRFIEGFLVAILNPKIAYKNMKLY